MQQQQNFYQRSEDKKKSTNSNRSNQQISSQSNIIFSKGLWDGIWKKRIKIQFQLVKYANIIPPPPLIISIPAVHYLDLYTPHIYNYYKLFIPYPYHQKDIYYEYEVINVQKNYKMQYQRVLIVVPVSCYSEMSNNQILKIKINFENKKEKMNLCQIYKYYLKEACCIKYRKKGAQTILSKISNQNFQKMFLGYKACNLKIFLQGQLNEAFKFIYFEDVQNQRYLPIRIIYDSFSCILSRYANIQNDKINIGQWLVNQFPNIFGQTNQKFLVPSNYQVCLFNEKINFNIPLLLLYQECYYPDGWVYLTIKTDLKG